MSHADDEARMAAELLGALDHELPAITADDVIARARAVDARRHRLSWAAGLVAMFTATGLAASLPGSPLREWVAKALQGDRNAAAESAREASGAEGLTGPGVELAIQGPARVDFEAWQTAGELRVRRGGQRLSIQAVGGTAGFSVGLDNIEIQNTGSIASFELAIPTGLDALSVRVAGVTVFELAEGRIALPPGAGDRALEEGLVIALTSP